MMKNKKYKQFKVYYHDEFEDKTVTTDWDVFKTKKKAIERLNELKDEFGNEGDEYSVTEVFIISEKQFLRELKKVHKDGMTDGIKLMFKLLSELKLKFSYSKLLKHLIKKEGITINLTKGDEK